MEYKTLHKLKRIFCPYNMDMIVHNIYGKRESVLCGPITEDTFWNIMMCCYEETEIEGIDYLLAYAVQKEFIEPGESLLHLFGELRPRKPLIMANVGSRGTGKTFQASQKTRQWASGGISAPRKAIILDVDDNLNK